MRDYEIVYIFDTTIADEAVEQKLDRFHGIVTDAGGEITAVDPWGKRQLTYPIRKRTAGNYVVAQFRSDPDTLTEFERLLKLDEDLIRYLIVLHEGEPTAPMSIATREPGEDDDDDDDDYDDEED